MSIPQHVTENFKTLSHNFEDGRVALVETTEKETGHPYYLICMVNNYPDCPKDQQIEFVPVAAMLLDIPYERFENPAKSSEKEMKPLYRSIDGWLHRTGHDKIPNLKSLAGNKDFMDGLSGQVAGYIARRAKEYEDIENHFRIEEIDCGDGRLTPHITCLPYYETFATRKAVEIARETFHQICKPSGELIGGFGRLYSKEDMKTIVEWAIKIMNNPNPWPHPQEDEAMTPPLYLNVPQGGLNEKTNHP